MLRHHESLKEICGGDQSSVSDVLKKLRDVGPHEKKLDVLLKDVIKLAA